MKAIFVCFCLLIMNFLQAHSPETSNEPIKNEQWSPDFLIVGAQKSGTTALFEFINQHPLVVNKSGEIHFFDLQFDKGIAWYKDQFPVRPTPKHIIGEKSPYYMVHPHVPQRVYSLFPKIKIIMILRNPIDRAYSQYWMNFLFTKAELLPFEPAVRSEPSRIYEGQELMEKDTSYESYEFKNFTYITRGLYVEQIKRWYALFPREQILILSTSDLEKKPDQVMETVFSFLGLPKVPIVASNSINKTHYPPMNAEIREWLQAVFRRPNRMLEEFLDRKFGWD